MYTYKYTYDMYSKVQFLCMQHLRVWHYLYTHGLSPCEFSGQSRRSGNFVALHLTGAHPKRAQQMECFKPVAPQQKLSLQRCPP